MELPKWQNGNSAVIDMGFVKASRESKTRSRPSYTSPLGVILLLVWTTCFILYLVARIGHTLDRNSGYLAYQLLFLVAEMIVGIATMFYGFTQVTSQAF